MAEGCGPSVLGRWRITRSAGSRSRDGPLSPKTKTGMAGGRDRGEVGDMDEHELAAELYRRRHDKDEWEDKPAEVKVQPVRTEVVSFRVPSDVLDLIERLAEEAGQSISEFMREAVTAQVRGAAMEPLVGVVSSGPRRLPVQLTIRTPLRATGYTEATGWIPDIPPPTVADLGTYGHVVKEKPSPAGQERHHVDSTARRRISSRRNPHMISCEVFDDANGNGEWDPDERPVPGAEVTLIGPDGSKRTRKTGEDGTLTFKAQTDGVWKIELQAPHGAEITKGPPSHRRTTGGPRAPQLVRFPIHQPVAR